MATTDYCGISEKRGVVRRAIEDGLYDFRTLYRAPCTVCRRPDCRRGEEARAPIGERQGKGKGHLLGKDRGREKGIELESVPKTQALARGEASSYSDCLPILLWTTFVRFVERQVARPGSGTEQGLRCAQMTSRVIILRGAITC